MSDWSPETYARFRGLRLRPALDLLAQVPDLPKGAVIDLGCGEGAAAGALAARYPGRMLAGIDGSPAMLDGARRTGLYAELTEADICDWRPKAAPALIFSNAALHWVEDHDGLLRRLAGMLAPGGVLAVQMPRQYAAPSHALLRRIATELFPDRFDFTGWVAPVHEAAAYYRLLAPLGAVTAWESTYIQRLVPGPEGHPVRRFTESTAMRSFLAGLSAKEAASYVAAYEAALASAYPVGTDGAVPFPFTRVFFVLHVAEGGAAPVA